MRKTVLAVLLTLALPSVALAQVSDPHGAAGAASVQKALDNPARAADQADDARRNRKDHDGQRDRKSVV